MKPMNILARAILALNQPRWARPARIILMVVATAMTVTGCPRPHH